MRRRAIVLLFGVLGLFGAACGGAPRASTADALAINQPTPDPTLAAVVRDLPRALAGVAPTPTPPPVPVAPVPKVTKPAAPAPTARPAQRAASPTPTARARR